MINNLLSERKDMICVVQQGSFLDTLSLMIYTNDFVSVLKRTKSILLTDDTPI